MRFETTLPQQVICDPYVVFEESLSIQARLLYVLLCGITQVIKELKDYQGYLERKMGLKYVTIKQYFDELKQAGLVEYQDGIIYLRTRHEVDGKIERVTPQPVGRAKAKQPKEWFRGVTIELKAKYPSLFTNDKVDGVTFEQEFRDFVAHRQQINKPLTELAAEKMLRKTELGLEKFGRGQVMKAYRRSIINNWQDIFFDQAKKETSNNKTDTLNTLLGRARAEHKRNTIQDS